MLNFLRRNKRYRINLVGSSAKSGWKFVKLDLTPSLEVTVAGSSLVNGMRPWKGEVFVIWHIPSAEDLEHNFVSDLKETVQRARKNGADLIIWVSPPAQVYQGALSEEQALCFIKNARRSAKGISAEVNLTSKMKRWGSEGFLKHSEDSPSLSWRGLRAASSSIKYYVLNWLPLQEIATISLPHLKGVKDGKLRMVLKSSSAEADKIVSDSLGFTEVPHPFGLTALPEAANMLKDGHLKLKGYESITLDSPIDWKMPGPDRTWATQFQALDFLQNLISEWVVSQDDSYLLVGIEIIRSWDESNPPSRPTAPRAWHEGTCAKRVFNLVPFLGALITSGIDAKGEIVRIVRVLEQHGHYLTKDSVYIIGGNHGYRQDLAVLYLTCTLPGLENAETWQNTAFKRLQTLQLAKTLSEEGVFLEHSPGYHFFAMGMLLAIISLNTYCKNGAPKDVLVAASNMVRYATHVLKPNGDIPQIGDSVEKKWDTKRHYESLLQLNEGQELLYSATCGKTGNHPIETCAVFPDGGWAIVRDSWNDTSFYLNFHATFRSPRHKHADDLSFILWAFGRDWIIDPGKYNYELSDPYRDYFALDASAHNCWTVDGESYPIKSAKKKRPVKFTSTVIQEEIQVFGAQNTLYKKASVFRNIVVLPRRHTILLVDILSSPVERVWRHYLHLAPDLDVSESSGYHVAVDKMGGGMAISPGVQIADQRVIRGETNPIQGWISTSWNVRIPAPVIEHTYQGRDEIVVTCISVSKNADASRRRATYEIKDNDLRISPSDGREDILLVLDNSRGCVISAEVLTVNK